MVQLSLWGLLSQEVEASLRQPLLRELLRLPILRRLLELPLSLLSLIRRHGSRQQAAGSRQQGLRSGRSPDWLKMKNADAPAAKREAEEDWGKEKMAITQGKMPFVFGMVVSPRQQLTQHAEVRRTSVNTLTTV